MGALIRVLLVLGFVVKFWWWIAAALGAMGNRVRSENVIQLRG